MDGRTAQDRALAGRRRARRALLVLAGGALLATAPTPSRSWEVLSSAASSPDPFAPLVAVVALLAWALLLWLGLLAALTLAGQGAGRLARLADRASRRVAPAVVRRGIAVALGVGLAVTTAGPASAAGSLPRTTSPAATSVDGSPSAPVAGQAGSGVLGPLDLDWPTATPLPTGTPISSPTPTGAPTPAGARSGAEAPSGADRPSSPARPPAPPRSSPPRSAAPSPPPASSPPGPVVVRPGDTLWGLAEAALRSPGGATPTDAAVAAAWPAWWSANRTVIGEDPDLILPGTRLVPPGGSAAD